MGVENGDEGCAEFFELLEDGGRVGGVDDGGGVVCGIVQDENIVVGAGGEAIDIHRVGIEEGWNRGQVYDCVYSVFYLLLNAVFCLAAARLN